MHVLSKEEIAVKLKYLSCKQVAESMGNVTGAFLNYIRNGQANPSLEMRKRITLFFIEAGYHHEEADK